MITAIVQARMSSTRLPGKVMTKFSGNTLLGHIIERISHSRYISKIIVATTTNPQDEVLLDWLYENHVSAFAGSESDVLKRFYEAARVNGALHIVRITSDDPFKDPYLIDRVADLYFDKGLDFAYNNQPPTFPEGLDTEIFSFEALASAEKGATDPFEREHMTQHFYRNPTKYKQQNLSNKVDLSHLRWTIDTGQDLEMAKLVYAHLHSPGKIFSLEDILQLLKENPAIASINQGVARSAMYKKN